MGLARAIGQHSVQQDIGFDQRVIVTGLGPDLFDDIGADHREVGPGEGFHQEIKPVVEFMIAQGRGVKAKRIHRLDYRVHVAFFHAALISDVIAHRIALQEVAVVQHQRIGRLGADRLDDAGGAGKSDGVDLFVGVIVIGKDMHMQVRRLHQAQVRLIGGSTEREGVKGQQTGRAGEKVTAVEAEGHAAFLLNVINTYLRRSVRPRKPKN